MNTGFDIRPVQSISVAPARVELGPERQIARTELPETKVVLSAAETQRQSADQDDQTQKIRAALNVRIDALQESPQKKVSFDDDTKELVFRTVSAETGKVVSQFPDEAYLRQRAYAERLLKAEQVQAAESKETASDERVEKVA